jgi:hypothetical protein
MTGNNGNGQPSSDKPEWPDDLPPCMIYVDKEGRMWHQGAEMIHKGINRLLTDHVELDHNDRYIIRFKGQECYVEVEDTLFVINRVEALVPDGPLPPDRLVITLNDGTSEELDPATLRQNQENIMYATVKSGRFPARFLRSGYYQLAEYVIETKDGFGLNLASGVFTIAMK